MQRLILVVHMDHELDGAVAFAIEAIGGRHAGAAQTELRMHDLADLLRSDVEGVRRPTGQVEYLAAKGCNVSIDGFLAVAAEAQMGDDGQLLVHGVPP